jgi:hypothetical protein
LRRGVHGQMGASLWKAGPLGKGLEWSSFRSGICPQEERFARVRGQMLTNCCCKARFTWYIPRSICPEKGQEKFKANADN